MWGVDLPHPTHTPLSADLHPLPRHSRTSPRPSSPCHPLSAQSLPPTLTMTRSWRSSSTTLPTAAPQPTASSGRCFSLASSLSPSPAGSWGGRCRTQRRAPRAEMQEGPLMKEQKGGKEGLNERLWNGGQILGRKPASCCWGGNGQRDTAQSVPRSHTL